MSAVCRKDKLDRDQAEIRQNAFHDVLLVSRDGNDIMHAPTKHTFGSFRCLRGRLKRIFVHSILADSTMVRVNLSSSFATIMDRWYVFEPELFTTTGVDCHLSPDYSRRRASILRLANRGKGKGEFQQECESTGR